MRTVFLHLVQFKKDDPKVNPVVLSRCMVILQKVWKAALEPKERRREQEKKGLFEKMRDAFGNGEKMEEGEEKTSVSAGEEDLLEKLLD